MSLYIDLHNLHEHRRLEKDYPECPDYECWPIDDIVQHTTAEPSTTLTCRPPGTDLRIANTALRG